MAPDDPLTRTALVTGASRGIGRATVDALAASGWQVVAGVRDSATLESPITHRAVRVVHLDVTDPVSIREAVGQAEDIAGGPLACVINNAGWALFGAIEDVDLDVARAEFETNFFGAAAVLQAALPAMRTAGSGVVVSVSSLIGRVPFPLFGMYSATKLSLCALSESLALELAPAGIRVILVEAGVVNTDLARSTIVSGLAGEPESVYAETRNRILGTIRSIRNEAGLAPRDVADALVRAVDDPAAPFRLYLPDARLGGLAAGVERSPDDCLVQVRRFFGLDGGA
jgi:NAD(P)-dependent dehydrogenase (short-subunit alcohol dehydrogenase family)